MWNLKAGFVNSLIAVEQQVEVERARAIRSSSGTVAAKGALDLKQCIQQFARAKRSFESNHSVYKPRLIGKAHRLGGVEPRARSHATNHAQPANGRNQRSLGRTGQTGQIAAQTDVSGNHSLSVLDPHGRRPVLGFRVRERRHESGHESARSHFC